MRHTFQWLPHGYAFWLPRHKADIVFEGNWVICQQIVGTPNHLPIMWQYLEAWDQHFPLHPQLWLQANGTIPLQAWWMSQFWWFFPSASLAGRSMHAGGATALAEARAMPDLIMGSGRRSSQAWTSYVWKKPSTSAHTDSCLNKSLTTPYSSDLQPFSVACGITLKSFLGASHFQSQDTET